MSACFSDVTCICNIMSHFDDVRWQCWHHLLSLFLTVAINTVMETPISGLTQGSYDRLPHDECYYVPSTNCLVRTYILCIQRLGSLMVSISRTWGHPYHVGHWLLDGRKCLLLGTFLQATAYAYCTLVLREVQWAWARWNDLVTEWYFCSYTSSNAWHWLWPM